LLNGILIPTVFPTNRIYSFIWSGPNTFTSFQQDAIISNVSEVNNGAYSLVITDQFGCSSPPQTTTIDISNMPVAPTLNSISPLCQGQSFVLNITNADAYNGTNIQYIWETPFGLQTTALPSLEITNADNFHSGNYTAYVNVNGCNSNQSALTQVSINSIPPAPIVSSNAPLCQNDTLVFATTSISGAIYNWSGPSGFSASVTNPIIAGVSTLSQGNYFLSYTLNGCQSPLSMPNSVIVKPLPTTPIAINNGAVCLDAPLDTLLLSIAENTHQSGATYIWYNGFNQQAISTPNFSSTLQMTNFQGAPSGNNGYYTIATMNGCTSQASNTTFVKFDTIPSETAFAGNDFNACDAGIIALQASSAAISVGNWSQVSGNTLIINTPTSNSTTITGGLANQNYNFRWSLSNGACLHFSSDTVEVKVRNYIPAESIAFIDSCYVQSVKLSAILPQGIVGTWSQPPNQVSPLNIIISNPNDPNATVTGMTPGNVYYFYWSLSDLGCGVASDTTVVRSIGSYASAGNDLNVCNPDGCYTLTAAALPLYESGRWETPHTDIALSTPNQIACTMCNLQQGNNTFFWTTNNGVCGGTSRDTITIYYEFSPTAVDDTITIPFGSKSNIDVSLNDILPDDYEIELSAPPTHGTVEKISNGVYRYQPSITFYGEDFFIYKVCNSNCVDACTFGRVNIIVLEQGDCKVATVLTPNGDNVNDIFYVPCLESDEFPDNDVTIYNEYGNEVFNAHNYKNTWDGTYKGSQLPVGTYFYFIKFNGTKGEKSGFVELVR
jgi:gliding motility-associated-like protein